jgi:hypothetical protein
MTSAFQLERVVSLAMQTLEMLRTTEGQIIETSDELLTALAEEGIPVERVLRLLIGATLDAKSLGIAADQRIADIRQRRERFQRHETTYRTLIQSVMDALGLKKFAAEEATLTLGVGQPKVMVTDPDALPDDVVTVVTTRTPDKAKIRAALLLGEEVAGAMLSNATTVLTVRSR